VTSIAIESSTLPTKPAPCSRGCPACVSSSSLSTKKQQRATNFYVWESSDAADAFFSEELRERVTGLYGVRPKIDFVEIAQIVDNSNLKEP